MPACSIGTAGVLLGLTKMPISHPLRTIFVHIPKTGGTSIEVALGVFGSWKEENCDSLFGQIQSPSLCAKGWVTRYLQHLSIAEICDLVPPENRFEYFTFSWIRNPWDRMVSIYSNKDPDMLQYARLQGQDLVNLSFPDFVEACMALSHIHLRPQHEFILDDQNKLMVDYVGRFESFEANFASICQRCGIDAQLPHQNKSQHFEYRSYYNKNTRELIAKRYAKDIDVFGYYF